MSAKDEAKRLLNDKAAFDKAYDICFAKYDTNKDGNIDLTEYLPFLKDMLTQMGRKQYDFKTSAYNFDKADKDSNGQISKEEFKKEFHKRLRDFANS
jgi:Ca2+-binding EF-hand superfamily protein